MSWTLWLAAACAAVVFVYLVVALFRPETFS